MTRTEPTVTAGVDTHADTHHAALITQTGQHLADRQFPATPAGYAELCEFITGHGPLDRVGVEGTSSYGAGLTGVLLAAGLDVVEVIRPSRVQRRRGKSDPIDAYAAAAAALAGEYLPVPKTPCGIVDAIRPLLIARRSAVKASGDAMRQIKSLLVTAPVDLRERFRDLSDARLIAALSTRSRAQALDAPSACRCALGRLARRYQALTAEAGDLEADLDRLVTAANPALRAAHGVGPITGAQLLITAGDNPERITTASKFAALAGVSPIPASSGKSTRYRLNRGGDRQANCALHQIALARMSSDPRTRAYVARRTTDGKTKPEVMRCLKRAIAREVYQHLVHPQPVPTVDDLRPLRQARHITLEQAARELGCWASDISRLERGIRRNDLLAKRYRDWLHTHPAAT